MNKDQLNGKAKKITGNIQAVTGKWMDKPALEEKGKVTQAKGVLQEAYGDAKEHLSDVQHTIKDAIQPK